MAGLGEVPNHPQSRKEPLEETCAQPTGAHESLLNPTERGATYCIPRMIFLQGTSDKSATTDHVNTSD